MLTCPMQLLAARLSELGTAAGRERPPWAPRLLAEPDTEQLRLRGWRRPWGAPCLGRDAGQGELEMGSPEQSCRVGWLGDG